MAFMQSPGGAALIQAGIGAATAAMQAKAQEEEEPQGYFGVGLSGNSSMSPAALAFGQNELYGGGRSWQPQSAAAGRLLMDPASIGGGG